MKFWKIRNYEKMQHYKGRRHQHLWIKLYKNIITSNDWAKLKDFEKCWLIALLCVSNEHGWFEFDASLIQVRAGLRRKPNLQKLADIGFIVPIDSNDEAVASSSLDSVDFQEIRGKLEKIGTDVDTISEISIEQKRKRARAMVRILEEEERLKKPDAKSGQP